MTTPNPKPCKVCGEQFTPQSTTTQRVCGVACAMKEARQKRAKQIEKARKREMREQKERLKTLSDWLKEAQAEFNKYIRLRDKDDPCISCQRHHTGQYHAGHYRSVGAAPELRFNEDNCHKQCAPCNNHKSGNAVDYRINLVNKIGIERVESLEGPHEPKRYRIDDAKQIKATYRQKWRELEKAA